MNVRRAAIGDEALLRSLRLDALTLEPDAFGSTYERELARTVDDWRRWLSPGVVFILEDAQGARGMVAAAHDSADHGIVQLMAMWVQPDARGSGGADALVAAVVGWAQSERARAVRLQVVDDNLRARHIYDRNGFKATGGTRVREKDQAIELQMERLVPSLSEADQESLHQRCSNNRGLLARSSRAGCFSCCAVFSPAEVTDWVDGLRVETGSPDDGITAVCPRCGIDSVIPEPEGQRLTAALLGEMRAFWF